MRRLLPILLLVAVEIGTAVYVGVAVHNALAAPSAGLFGGGLDLVPIGTSVAMLAVYAALTWVALSRNGR
jgi:hypothetical protein